MRIIIEKRDLSLWNLVKVFTFVMVLMASILGLVVGACSWTLNQRWCAAPIPPHRPYIDRTPPTPQTPLVHAGVHYGNGFWSADLVSSKTQVQWNLNGDDCRQNTPFRVNAHTDVPVDFVTDMADGDSYLAVSMDRNALGSNRAGDPDYSAVFGWKNTETGSIYFDRKATRHDNDKVYVNVGGQRNGAPNHVMIGDAYVMPFGVGKPGQVITVPPSGNQLIWTTPEEKVSALHNSRS
jgi:hypothetical protein